MIAAVLSAYGMEEKDCTVQPFGSGLINNTWKIIRGNNAFILQRINDSVFKEPGHIASNIALAGAYLKKNHPDYLFIQPVVTPAGEEMVLLQGNYFRMFPFVPGSHTIDIVTEPQQAFEAARQFGAFTKKLSGLDSSALQISLPDFHNLSLRYRQFEQALIEGNQQRINAAAPEIALLKEYHTIVDIFEQIKQDPAFKLRVTHHDTKISNVLFDDNDKGVCVIDLDTVMPGYFISDVGDMLRTYLSPANEEETNFSKIEVRKDYVAAIQKGYLSEMDDELTPKEKGAFIYAGKFMTYMQALRFLTDHLNNDSYYGATYEGHNLMRAKNQLTLLQQLSEIEN